jgi:putative spermidine/putrescine transport system ATP-binding protein
MNHLEVSNLRFSRDGFSVAVSFSLRKGQTGVLLGPSGCGKTTLLRCIAGLEAQDEGSISIEGKPIDALPPERRNLGFIFQDLALFDHLTGRQNIAFGMKLRGQPATEAESRIEALAGTLKIRGLLGRRPYAMSGGERQRLAFARAVAPRPELLLMDEPLSSLDAPLRRELRAYLRSSLRAEGVTALHVTHDVEEALELGDMIFVMKNGRIVVSGTPEEIWADPPDAWCVKFLGLGALLAPDLVKNPSLAASLKGAGIAAAAQLFVPRGCAKLCAPGMGLPSAGVPGAVAAEGIFRGEAADVIFLGDRRRVLVQLEGASGEGSDPLAIDVEAGWPIAKGESVGVRIQLERCRLLPAEKLDGDRAGNQDGSTAGGAGL